MAVGATSGLTATSNTFRVSVPSTFSIGTGQSLTTLPGMVTGGALTSFGGSENVTIHLDSATGTTLFTSPSTLSTGSNGGAGGFGAAVPSGVADGTHTLVAVGATSGLTATSNTFTVNAPAFSIGTGQSLTTLPGMVSGGALTSFGSSENVTIHLDSATGTTLFTSPSTLSTGSNGGAGGFGAAIPSGVADGTHTLVAVGATSGLTATSNTFTVSVPSTLSFSTRSLTGLPGTLAGGTITYFKSNEGATLHLDSATGTTLTTAPSTVSTGSNGRASGISVTIPSGVATGTHTVYAVGSSGSQATYSFTVSVFAASELKNGDCASLSSGACSISGNFTTTSGRTDLILVNLMGSNSSSSTVSSVTGPFTSASQIASEPYHTTILGGRSSYLYAWEAVGDGSSGSVAVTFGSNYSISGVSIEVVQLGAGNSEVKSSTGSGNGFLFGTATVSIAASSSTDSEIAFLGTDGGFSFNTPSAWTQLPASQPTNWNAFSNLMIQSPQLFGMTFLLQNYGYIALEISP